MLADPDKKQVCVLNSHWPIDDEGHHNVHISDVFPQVRVGQVQLRAPEKHQRNNEDQMHCKMEKPLIHNKYRYIDT